MTPLPEEPVAAVAVAEVVGGAGWVTVAVAAGWVTVAVSVTADCGTVSVARSVTVSVAPACAGR